MEEAYNILSDKKYYTLLPNNPLPEHLISYTDLISFAHQEGILNKKEKDFLLTKNPVMPLFYFLPKVHKNPIKPPGRPIIAGIDSLTSGLSHYIDLHLQKYVITIPSYLRASSLRLKTYVGHLNTNGPL